MQKFGDGLIMVIAAGIMVWWVWRRFDRWLHEPPGARLRKLASEGNVVPDDTVALLEQHGYDTLTGKHKVPLGVIVDNGSVQRTQLFFDYLAQKDQKYYLVKLERARKPTEWTASGLRERFLVYALLFPDCEGIIVVDPQDRLVRTIRFKVEDDDE
ncbi:MAG: hypothetical protein P0Y55_06055 [Candidatus Cohnella colombiensis]|uniref:Uncharacterized protein n=1 Tax=Candidatus Cohnella colombiensis TaxID=3121368 RepID=A0AA95EZC3_9BACL|nr:MAG: hypothetical protein P0Y55_06055 [Cohnella sp.]